MKLIEKILILIKSKNHSVLYTKWDFYRREISLKKRIFFKKKENREVNSEYFVNLKFSFILH